MNERQFYLVKVVKKLRVFQGFEFSEIQQILRVALLKDYSKGDEVYQYGKPSHEFLVLLKGSLIVTGEFGEEIARIRPGTSVGEMGVLTEQPRSATVEAAEDSTAMAIGRNQINALFAADKEMHVKVLTNLVHILSVRINEANTLIESHSRMIRDLEKQLEAAGNRAYQ